MSEFMKRKTVIVGLTAVLMSPVALAGEGHEDHQKGQATQGRQMDHGQMQGMDHGKMSHDQMQGMDHGSMKHEHNADEAKAGQDHDR
ncbi:hypothetical protein [Metapseudomonas furukawaii]